MTDPTPLDEVEGEIAALRDRVRELTEAPADVTPPPTSQELFAAKLRETQGQWFTVEA